jgi:hypothetical protein
MPKLTEALQVALPTTREDLVAHAIAAYAGIPRYKGYFDDWVMVKVLRSLRTKGRVDFKKGEFVIAEPAEWQSGITIWRMVYSPRLKCMRGAYPNEVRNVDGSVPQTLSFAEDIHRLCASVPAHYNLPPYLPIT